MTGVAVDREPQRLGLVAADHDADVAALAIQHRRLLDMQFEIGIEFTADRRRAGIADLVERLLHRDAGIVGGGKHAFQGDHLGEGHGSHHRRIEARAFLVGPADDLDAALGLQATIVQRAHDLQAAQHAQDAVVAATAYLRVEVTANGDRRQRRIGARPPREDVPQPIDLDRAARCLGPFHEQVAHLLVLGRKSEAAQADVAEATDLRRSLETVPQALGIDLQDICDHAALLLRAAF